MGATASSQHEFCSSQQSGKPCEFCEAGPSYAAAYEHYVKQGYVGSAPPKPGWHTGLCSCLVDVPSCLLGCFCPCVAFGRNVEVLDDGQTACVAASLLWCLLEQLTLCGCIYSCWYRRKLRNKFHIPEGPCPDCCVHCCCFPCAFCQETREMEYRSKEECCTVTTPPQCHHLLR